MINSGVLMTCGWAFYRKAQIPPGQKRCYCSFRKNKVVNTSVPDTIHLKQLKSLLKSLLTGSFNIFHFFTLDLRLVSVCCMELLLYATATELMAV